MNRPALPPALLFVAIAILVSPPCLREACAADLPETFDLRDVDGVNYVTSIKSQQGGTCWTHGAMASMEGNLMMTGVWAANGEEGEPDLAEYHLDWWNGFNEHYNADADPPTGGGLTVHMGGDYMVTSAYLTRGDGAVRDIDGQSYETPPDYVSGLYHYYYPRHIEWFTAGETLERISDIKARLMEEGVIGTCMCYSSEFMNEDFIHYQPPGSPYDPNHAIAIIGWDDNLVTQAPLPGAWLCKNSWGEGWGLDGFFWISYHDRWCGQEPEMGAVSFREIEPLAYDQIYYHDYHGWRDEMTDADTALNAFVAESAQMIEGVGIFTCDDGVSYTVRIYRDFNGETPSGLESEETGTFEHTGFHVVDLGDPVFVEEGESFFVYLEVDDGGLAYDRTSDVPVLLGAQYRTIVESSASPGESFYYSGGYGWQDLYYWSGNPYPGTGNFCMKALAVDYGLAVEPDGGIEFSGPVEGPFSPSTYDVELENNGLSGIDYFVSVSPAVTWLTVYGPTSGYLPAEGTVSLSFEVNSNADTLSPGAYSASVSFVNTSEHYGDTTLPLVLLVGDPAPFYEAGMDQDPGWACEGQWEWGVPRGFGGQHGYPDPTSGYTGANVVGYNLAGDYENNMPPYSLTTDAIDCEGMHCVTLSFQRWLGVQENGFDKAEIQVSTNMSDWTAIWANPGSPPLTDSTWASVSYDISSIADDQPAVYIRWIMGPTNDGWVHCGWNIDDVAVSGIQDMGSGGTLTLTTLLDPVWPNPVTSESQIRYHLPASDFVQLRVYDMAGRLVRSIEEGFRLQGAHTTTWDGSGDNGQRLPSGVYFVQVEGCDSFDSKKVVVLR